MAEAVRQRDPGNSPGANCTSTVHRWQLTKSILQRSWSWGSHYTIHSCWWNMEIRRAEASKPLVRVRPRQDLHPECIRMECLSIVGKRVTPEKKQGLNGNIKRDLARIRHSYNLRLQLCDVQLLTAS